MPLFFTKTPQEKAIFAKLMATPQKIVLTSHQNPDGDAFGSMLGLWHFFKQMGHQVHAISPTGHADFLNWMPGTSEVINFENELDRPRAKRLLSEADILFYLDFSALNRLKDLGEFAKETSAKKVLIDHHQQPENIADFVFWDEHAAATCQLIYRFITEMGWLQWLNKDAASCLYTGILTDTGSFKFESTTKEVHQIAGDLMEKGINVGEINRLLFDQNTLNRTRFLGYALHEKLVVLEEFGVAYFAFSNEEQKAFDIKKGDTEGVVNFGLGLAGVNVAALFIEKEDGIRISFRSAGDISVADFAREHFEGGGHKNAAGGRSNESLENTVSKFLALLPQYQNKIV